METLLAECAIKDILSHIMSLEIFLNKTKQLKVHVKFLKATQKNK